MTATIHAQNTGTMPTRTGPLTVPLQIIRAANARHRDAIEKHSALPGWALAAVTVWTAVLIVFAVLQWRDLGSPLLIACALLGAAAAFTPDVIAALAARNS
jgi:hypothetical protein